VASVYEYRTLNINVASTTLQPFAIVNGTLTIGDNGGQPIKVENTRPPLPRQPALSQARSTRGISQVVRAPRNRGGSQFDRAKRSRNKVASVPAGVAAMLGHASVATTLRLYAHVTHASTEALVDAIDARFGARLRVLPQEVLDQYWTRKVEIGATATETECRERESNPPKLAQNDRKKRCSSSSKRPGSAP
jgi:hypothetical protein